MTRGYPDWSNKRKTAYVNVMQDSGELAVRLGSPVWYDRRGDVWFMDAFEDGVGPWILQGGGTGAALVASGGWFASGGIAAKLTGASDAALYGQMQRYLYLPPLAKQGISSTFSLGSYVDYLRLQLTVREAGRQKAYAVRLDLANGKLQYRDSADAWQDVAASVDISSAGAGLAAWKLVVDLENHVYSHVLFGRNAYSLAGIAPHDQGAFAGDYLIPIIRVDSQNTFNGVVYVDNVIITTNEP